MLSQTIPSTQEDGLHPKPPQHLLWETLEEKEREDHYIFALSKRTSRHPSRGTHDFVILDCPAWINVIALTPDDQVVLVRQYRHGTQTVTLEIPGGMVDLNEAPWVAAKRELQEETGFLAPTWYELGVVEPNPAFQTNRCWTYLALNATRQTELRLDDSEVIDVEFQPLQRIPELIQQGVITHSLVIAAFFHWLQRTSGWERPKDFSHLHTFLLT